MDKGFWYCSVVLLCLRQSESKVYKSVQWTPQNPKFNKDQVFLLNVLPNSQLTVVCPTIGLDVTEMQNSIRMEEMYENLWIVDKVSYDTCVVNSSNQENKLLIKCMDPSKIDYKRLQFKEYSASLDNPKYVPGQTYYFISTSDGSLNSVNNTRDGNCASKSMRMEVYVCRDSKDLGCEGNIIHLMYGPDGNNPACQPTVAPTSSHRNTTIAIEPPTKELRKSAMNDAWHLLTIIFGVAFAVSFVINSVCLVCVCRRKAKKEKSLEAASPLHPKQDEKGVDNIQATCNVYPQPKSKARI